MPARKLSQKDQGENRGRDADNQQMVLPLEAQTTAD